MISPLSPATTASAFARPLRTRGAFARCLRHPLALWGLLLLAILLFLAIEAPRLGRGVPGPLPIALQSFPHGLDSLGVPHPPGDGFLLGADSQGRDVWTRLLFGARLSLSIALCAMLTSIVIGTTIGLLGGYFGGAVDRSLTRLTEIIASLPTILLVITLTLVLPDSWRSAQPLAALSILPKAWQNWQPFIVLGLDPRIVLAIGLVTWTGISRAVRGQVLSFKEREFVEAARALGQGNGRIMFRHILPNVLPTVITLATLAVSSNILLEASLSYLGLGPPEAPSWGSMIAEGQPYFGTAPWITLAPGFAIVLAVVAWNLLGTALTESLETRR